MRIHGGINVLVILADNYLFGHNFGLFVSNQPDLPSSTHISIRSIQQAKE
jgi:hypothetical protein